MEVTGNGMIAAYIHTGAKVGVLVEVGAGKEGTVASDDFKQLVKDITLQIAAGHPLRFRASRCRPTVVAKEREIAAEPRPQGQAAAGHRQDHRGQAREVLPDLLPGGPGLREEELRDLASRSMWRLSPSSWATRSPSAASSGSRWAKCPRRNHPSPARHAVPCGPRQAGLPPDDGRNIPVPELGGVDPLNAEEDCVRGEPADRAGGLSRQDQHAWRTGGQSARMDAVGLGLNGVARRDFGGRAGRTPTPSGRRNLQPFRVQPSRYVRRSSSLASEQSVH